MRRIVVASDYTHHGLVAGVELSGNSGIATFFKSIGPVMACSAMVAGGSHVLVGSCGQ